MVGCKLYEPFSCLDFPPLLCLFICWLFREHAHTQSQERISMKLGWRMALSLESTPLTFGADLGISSHFLRHCQSVFCHVCSFLDNAS